MARRIKTPNAEASNAIDAIQPGKIAHYNLTEEPLFFPPVADFPKGGRFHIRVPSGAQVQLRTEVGEPAYLLDEGHWNIATDAADEILLSGAGVTIRVMQQKEAAS